MLRLGGVSFIFQNNPVPRPFHRANTGLWSKPCWTPKADKWKRSCHNGGGLRVSAHSNSGLSSVRGVRCQAHRGSCYLLYTPVRSHSSTRRVFSKQNNSPRPKKIRGKFSPCASFLASATKLTELRSSGLLCSEGWEFVTDVSGKPVGQGLRLHTWPLKMGPIII